MAPRKDGNSQHGTAEKSSDASGARATRSTTRATRTTPDPSIQDLTSDMSPDPLAVQPTAAKKPSTAGKPGKATGGRPVVQGKSDEDAASDAVDYTDTIQTIQTIQTNGTPHMTPNMTPNTTPKTMPAPTHHELLQQALRLIKQAYDIKPTKVISDIGTAINAAIEGKLTAPSTLKQKIDLILQQNETAIARIDHCIDGGINH